MLTADSQLPKEKLSLTHNVFSRYLPELLLECLSLAVHSAVEMLQSSRWSSFEDVPKRASSTSPIYRS